MSFIGLLKESSSGDVKLINFDVEDDFELQILNLRSIRDFGSVMIVNPGNYWKIITKNVLQMSNTDMEIKTNQVLKEFHGDILIFGLGIGLAFDLLQWDNVEHVTVVDINEDVIKIISPFVEQFEHKDKITILQGDAFEFVPDKIYDYVWFDIWSNICKDNLEEMQELEDRARTWVLHDTNIGCWSKKELKDVYYCSCCEEDLSDCSCYRCEYCEELEEDCWCEFCDDCGEQLDYCCCEPCEECDELPSDCICY